MERWSKKFWDESIDEADQLNGVREGEDGHVDLTMILFGSGLRDSHADNSTNHTIPLDGGFRHVQHCALLVPLGVGCGR